MAPAPAPGQLTGPPGAMQTAPPSPVCTVMHMLPITKLSNEHGRTRTSVQWPLARQGSMADLDPSNVAGEFLRD